MQYGDLNTQVNDNYYGSIIGVDRRSASIFSPPMNNQCTRHNNSSWHNIFCCFFYAVDMQTCMHSGWYFTLLSVRVNTLAVHCSQHSICIGACMGIPWQQSQLANVLVMELGNHVSWRCMLAKPSTQSLFFLSGKDRNLKWCKGNAGQNLTSHTGDAGHAIILIPTAIWTFLSTYCGKRLLVGALR